MKRISAKWQCIHSYSAFFLPYLLFFSPKFHNVPRIHHQTKHLIPVAEKERRAYVPCEQYRMARIGRTKKYRNERDDVYIERGEPRLERSRLFESNICSFFFFQCFSRREKILSPDFCQKTFAWERTYLLVSRVFFFLLCLVIPCLNLVKRNFFYLRDYLSN